MSGPSRPSTGAEAARSDALQGTAQSYTAGLSLTRRLVGGSGREPCRQEKGPVRKGGPGGRGTKERGAASQRREAPLSPGTTRVTEDAGGARGTARTRAGRNSTSSQTQLTQARNPTRKAGEEDLSGV